MWFIGVEVKHETRLKNLYVKRRKHGSLARHITSQLRLSLVVHPLLRKILDPPCSTLNSSKYFFFAVSGGS